MMGLAGLARRSGISGKTAYKWIARFQERGLRHVQFQRGTRDIFFFRDGDEIAEMAEFYAPTSLARTWPGRRNESASTNLLECGVAQYRTQLLK